MKTFIIEITIVSSLFFLTGLILFQINIPSPVANNINNIEDKLDMVNLGTSHGGCFDYSFSVLNGTNINREGNTLYYDLQNYLFLDKKNYLSKNAIIIIPVSYYVFGLDENRTDRLPDDSFVNDFYYYLPNEQIFSYSKQKERNLIIYRIQENFQNLFTKFENTHIDRRISESELKNHAFHRVNSHKRLSAYSSTHKNLNYLETLIKEVVNNKHIPVLVSTPYHHSYNESYRKQWLDENYFDIMRGFSSKYKIPYLDYSHDKRLCFKSDYFSNSDHLNSRGKKLFNSIFFNDLQKLLDRMNSQQCIKIITD